MGWLIYIMYSTRTHIELWRERCYFIFVTCVTNLFMFLVSRCWYSDWSWAVSCWPYGGSRTWRRQLTSRDLFGHRDQLVLAATFVRCAHGGWQEGRQGAEAHQKWDPHVEHWLAEHGRACHRCQTWLGQAAAEQSRVHGDRWEGGTQPQDWEALEVKFKICHHRITFILSYDFSLF